MNKEELRPVEINIPNKETYKGWYLGQEQVVWNTRFNGGIEDMEAYSQAIIETSESSYLVSEYNMGAKYAYKEILKDLKKINKYFKKLYYEYEKGIYGCEDNKNRTKKINRLISKLSNEIELSSLGDDNNE